jgi:TRAP-type C4-dicarboxylate transport system permease small subunit
MDGERPPGPRLQDRGLHRAAVFVEEGVRRVIGLAGAAVLMAMMLLTFRDVVGRNLGHPIPGAKEATQVLLVALVFLLLPLISRERGHIVIDLLDAFIPGRAKAIQDVIVNLLGVVALWHATHALYFQAMRAFRVGDRVAFIGVPTGPIVVFMAGACALTVVAFALNAAGAFLRILRPAGGEP